MDWGSDSPASAGQERRKWSASGELYDDDDEDEGDDHCYLLQNSSSGKAALNHNEGKRYTFG